MGLLNGVDRVYYEGEDLGNYQFTSLDDIVNTFLVLMYLQLLSIC